MICKGHARTNGGQLAAYLADYLTHEKNEAVTVLEIRGSQFPDLHRSLSAWEVEAKRGKTRKALWHAQISPTPGEQLSREQMIEAASILERHLGYDGQPRAIVTHKKDGREHIHVVWSRIDRATGKAKRDDFTHRKNCDAAREIENRFGLHRVETPKFRSDDKQKTREQRREESKSAPGYDEFQKAKRTGIDPRERKRVITECWEQSDCGKALRASLQDHGYTLAHGTRRTFVVVDKAGDIHSLARQIKGAYVADVRERLMDVDPASIPKAIHIQQQLRAAQKERNADKTPPRPPNTPPRPELEIPPQVVMQDSTSDNSAPRDPLDPGNILADLTRQQSTFTKTDLSREVSKRLETTNAPYGQDEIDGLIRAVRKLPEFISLGPDRTNRPRYTSKDMLDTELLMKDTAATLASTTGHAVSDELREKAPLFAKLTPEQRTAFRHVTSASDLSNIVGYAGTGKSTMLGAAREAWEAAGYRVRGTSISSMASASLQQGSGIQSRTIASTLWRIKSIDKDEARLYDMNERIRQSTGRSDTAKRAKARMQAERDRLAAQVNATKLTSRDIVVVDEAGMVGSRQMTELLTSVQRAGAKVVLVGDAEQLQAIDAGGAFRALTDRQSAVEIKGVRRQNEEWQKQATRDFAQSFTEDGLAAYNQRGHIHKTETADQAYKQMVDAWTAVRHEHPEKTQLMMAFTKRDVHQLNQSARSAYRAEGRLGETDFEIATAQGNRSFSSGDRLYFLKNDLRLGVMNGSLGTIQNLQVSQIDPQQAQLTVALDTGKNVTFTTDIYNEFSHGYAATVHKAQGATIDKAHLLASRYMDRHAAYVGMSRHRETADLYYAAEEFRGYDRLVTSLSRDRRKDTTLDYLSRAEKAKEPERFWNRAFARRKARPVRTLLDKLGLRKEPERASPKDAAARAAEQLRKILGDKPKRRRAPGIGRGI